MKKAILFIASFAVLIISLSAFTDRASAPAIGYKAPQFILAEGESVITLADQRGKFVLLNFWTASDAESRIKCSEYERLAAEDNSLSIVSVNLDSSKALYREIVKRDGLDEYSQFHLEGLQSDRVVDLYRLEGNLKSFLIDPDGRILAVNPDASEVNKYII